MQKKMFSRPTDSSFSGYVIGNKDLFLGLKYNIFFTICETCEMSLVKQENLCYFTTRSQGLKYLTSFTGNCRNSKNIKGCSI